MNLRRLKYSDIEKIDEIWERCHKGKYGIPARNLLITEAVTENGKITGYGIARFFAEAMLFLDKDLSEYEQARSFKMLMEQAIIDCKLNGLDQLNVCVEDESFEKILRSHFKFTPRDKVLVLDLEKINGKQERE